MPTNPTKINQFLLANQPELAIQLARSLEAKDDFYYLLKFGEMLDYLRSFEQIHLFSFAFEAPDVEAIAKIEQQIGKPLHPSIRRFYEQCNGIQLYWLDKRNENYSILLQTNRLNEDLDGCIKIKGIDDIYNKNALETFGYGQNLMEKELSAEEVEASYHQFDAFSSFNDIMAYTGEGFEDNPLLIMGDDHQACYTDARLIDIPSYLELVFYCGGAIEGRRKFLKKYNGHQLPVLQIDTAYFEQFPKTDFSIYPTEFGFPASNFWK